MEKKRILFLIPSLASGGAERTLINLLNFIDYSKFSIDLLIVSNNGVYLNQIPDSVKIIPLFKNDLWVRIQSYLQKKIGLTLFFKMRIKHKVKGSYNLGISFLDSNFTDLLFYVQNLEKKVTWIHSSYKSYKNFNQYYSNNRYRDKIKLKRYSQLDGIYFVSNDAMDEFIEIFGTYPNMKVIYNIIDSESVIEKAKAEIINRGDKFTFIAIGSLLPVKGFDLLINAASIVKSRGYEFTLLIVGRGPEESKLKNLIIQLKINDNIKLLGYFSNPYPLLKSSDVFVMSSFSEALPTVLCEAMILGKPILVTNCSGCRELVYQNQFGLISEQNKESLAEKMIQYITMPELIPYYHKKSLERAAIFDDKKILDEYNSVFNM